MLWTFILVAALVLLALGGWRKATSTRSYSLDGEGFLMFGAVIGVCWLIAVTVGTAITVNSQLSSVSDAAVITERKEQRDQLAQLIRDELSAEQYADLMAALPTDGDVRIWLGDGASKILTSRAEQIIAINAEVYDRELAVVNKRKAVCDYVRNPFAPRFPFGVGLPGCSLKLEGLD